MVPPLPLIVFFFLLQDLTNNAIRKGFVFSPSLSIWTANELLVGQKSNCGLKSLTLHTVSYAVRVAKIKKIGKPRMVEEEGKLLVTNFNS